MTAPSERWLRALPTLRTAELRTGYLRSELLALAPAEAALALDAVCGLAEQTDPRARDVLAAATLVLADPAHEHLADMLRELATLRALLPLGRLLRRAPSHTVAETLTTGERRAATAAGRSLTLGERKSLARRPTRETMDKLLADPHPAVVRNLLANPRLTEPDVVRMAARRPAFPEVISEIARHPVWSQKSRVRLAIVQNPGSPPELAVAMVGLLIRPELELLARAGDVPTLVRAAALELLDRRPPVRGPSGDDGAGSVPQ
ncbi:MAG: hypothetical protein IT370_24575 [Deltaproteobacteria bacterium]|nr:hypothetical protein [Deltaproteobacteria bacterium]